MEYGISFSKEIAGSVAGSSADRPTGPSSDTKISGNSGFRGVVRYSVKIRLGSKTRHMTRTFLSQMRMTCILNAYGMRGAAVSRMPASVDEHGPLSSCEEDKSEPLSVSLTPLMKGEQCKYAIECVASPEHGSDASDAKSWLKEDCVKRGSSGVARWCLLLGKIWCAVWGGTRRRIWSSRGRQGER